MWRIECRLSTHLWHFGLGSSHLSMQLASSSRYSITQPYVWCEVFTEEMIHLFLSIALPIVTFTTIPTTTTTTTTTVQTPLLFITTRRSSTTEIPVSSFLCAPINPCGVHGRCLEAPMNVPISSRRFACICEEDWFGRLCDKQLDECE